MPAQATSSITLSVGQPNEDGRCKKKRTGKGNKENQPSLKYLFTSDTVRGTERYVV